MVKKNQNLSKDTICWPGAGQSGEHPPVFCSAGANKAAVVVFDQGSNCGSSSKDLSSSKSNFLQIKLPQKLTSSCSCVPRTTTRVTTTWPQFSSARVDDSRSRRRTPSSNLSCSSRTRCASRTTTESSCVQGQKKLVKNVKQTSQLESYKNPVGRSQLLGRVAGEATLGSRLMWSVFEGWHFLGVLFSRSEVLLNEGGGRTQT